MPKPFKLQSTRPLPPDAVIVEHEGKPHVRIKERARSVLYPLTKDGAKYLKPSKCWYFEYRDSHGTIRRKKGFNDLKATETLASETERNASRVRSGYADPLEEHVRRPLADHLADYATHLEAKGNTPDHIQRVVGRCRALFEKCGFVYPLDTDAGRVADWLNTLRRNAEPVAIPPGDEFRPGDVALLLGVHPSAVSAMVRRLQLPATGNGKARRFPRSTVEALTQQRAKGASPQTINHYIAAVRAFFAWMVRAKRFGADPLETLSLVNAATDVRRARRELDADELRRLFVATRASERFFRGLAGEDRYFLYLTAAATGFRVRALANLTPADFDLAAASPCVMLGARFNKSKKAKVQPLPADVAAALAGYLASKTKGTPVWGGTWQERAADMIREDLEAAGIAYAVEGPDGPEYADFHALRHSYLTLGGRSGIDLRTLQELAGHSKPELTARYSHRRLYDLAGAVEKLPSLVPTTPIDGQEVPLRLTGTDGENAPKRVVPGVVGVVPGVVIGGIERHQSALNATTEQEIPTEHGSTQPLEMKQPGTVRHQVASDDTNGNGGSRTHFQGFMRPTMEGCNLEDEQEVTSIPITGRSAGRSDDTSEGGIADADLAALVAAWPTLPEAIKAAIRALVGSVLGFPNHA